LPIWFWDLANPTYSAGMIAQVQRHTLESLRKSGRRPRLQAANNLEQH
jgi:hypothetical protein